MFTTAQGIFQYQYIGLKSVATGKTEYAVHSDQYYHTKEQVSNPDISASKQAPPFLHPDLVVPATRVSYVMEGG